MLIAALMAVTSDKQHVFALSVHIEETQHDCNRHVVRWGVATAAACVQQGRVRAY